MQDTQRGVAPCGSSQHNQYSEGAAHCSHNSLEQQQTETHAPDTKADNVTGGANHRVTDYLMLVIACCLHCRPDLTLLPLQLIHSAHRQQSASHGMT